VNFYSLSFDIEPVFDITNLPDFHKQKLPPIRQHVQSNFPDFRLRKLRIDFINLGLNIPGRLSGGYLIKLWH
jgi:hypothetical protein